MDKKNIKIFENTPYNSEKNLIKSYNSFMELLPNDAWALFRDGDTLFLDSFYGTLIEEAIINNPDTDFFTCMTNRIYCSYQKHEEYLGDDVRKHRIISNNLKEKHKGVYLDITNETKKISGMVMVLSKKSWLKIGGFKEFSNGYGNMLGVDNKLHIDLKDNGFKLKLIKGLYVYHWYRGGIKDDSHLK